MKSMKNVQTICRKKETSQLTPGRLALNQILAPNKTHCELALGFYSRSLNSRLLVMLGPNDRTPKSVQLLAILDILKF